MQSILESVLLYVEARDGVLDEWSMELLRSFVYSFWLIAVSKINPDEELDAAVSCIDLYETTIKAFQVAGLNTKNRPAADELIRICRNTSIESIERLHVIIPFRVEMDKARKEIREVCGHYFDHTLGNILTHQVGRS